MIELLNSFLELIQSIAILSIAHYLRKDRQRNDLIYKRKNPNQL